MVVEYGLNRRYGSVACSFAESVDGSVHSAASFHDGGEDIGSSQIVVVVGMEVEVKVRIARCHHAHEGGCERRIEYAECVGQHESSDAFVLERVDECHDVVGAVLHSVRPVFEVDVDIDAELACVVEAALDVGYVFL